MEVLASYATSQRTNEMKTDHFAPRIAKSIIWHHGLMHFTLWKLQQCAVRDAAVPRVSVKEHTLFFNMRIL